MISTTLFKTIIKILSNDRIPRTTILQIVEDLLAFYNKQIKLVINKLEITNSNETKTIADIVTILKSMLTPDYISSEYLSLKKLRALNVAVEARTVELSIEQNQVYSISNVIQTLSYPNFIKMVPLKELFSKTSILEHILGYIESIRSNKTTIYNIIQTSVWKNKIKRFNPSDSREILLLPILIYFDDFEPLNSLGSHSGILKLGAVYVKCLSRLFGFESVTYFFVNDILCTR